MEENNQYGNAMTKSLPTDSIKNSKKLPTMREFNLILQGISDTDKVGHLFIVDIEFDYKNASEKELFFNEIYTPIFEKKKVLSANERSTFQLLDAMILDPWFFLKKSLKLFLNEKIKAKKNIKKIR